MSLSIWPNSDKQGNFMVKVDPCSSFDLGHRVRIDCIEIPGCTVGRLGKRISVREVSNFVVPLIPCYRLLFPCFFEPPRLGTCFGHGTVLCHSHPRWVIGLHPACWTAMVPLCSSAISLQTALKPTHGKLC